MSGNHRPEEREWKPLRRAFCKLLDFPDQCSWQEIYDEVERRLVLQCDHNWVDDYMGDPEVPGGQMFFGDCTKCGVSSDSPDKNAFEAPRLNSDESG